MKMKNFFKNLQSICYFAEVSLKVYDFHDKLMRSPWCFSMISFISCNGGFPQTYELAIFETIKCNFEFAADDDDGSLPYQSILVNVGPLHLFRPLACQHHWPSQNIQVLLIMKKHKDFNTFIIRNVFSGTILQQTCPKSPIKTIYSQQVATNNTLSTKSVTVKAGVHTSLCHKANDSDSLLHYIKHAVKSVRPRGQ